MRDEEYAEGDVERSVRVRRRRIGDSTNADGDFERGRSVRFESLSSVVGVACALRGRLASALYLMNRTDIVTAVNTCNAVMQPLQALLTTGMTPVKTTLLVVSVIVNWNVTGMLETFHFCLTV